MSEERTAYQHRLNLERAWYGELNPLGRRIFAADLPHRGTYSGEARERCLARRKVERFADRKGVL